MNDEKNKQKGIGEKGICPKSRSRNLVVKVMVVHPINKNVEEMGMASNVIPVIDMVILQNTTGKGPEGVQKLLGGQEESMSLRLQSPWLGLGTSCSKIELLCYAPIYAPRITPLCFPVLVSMLM